MDTFESKRISNIKWFRKKISYGLFWHGLLNRLGKIGIVIKPYYWVQEEGRKIESIVIKENPTDYSLHRFGTEEIKIICNGLGYNEKIMLDGLKKGQICLGLKYKTEIAAFMFIELNDFKFKNKSFKLADNEAYIFNMHTFEQHRGKNLAPYLKSQSFKLLDEMGRFNKFSITEYFNKSSIKFKKKLNPKNLKLYVYIQIFKMINRTFLLKNYDN